MDHFKLTYSRYSETSILVEWPQYIAPEILSDILLFKTYLLKENSESIIQITNAYSSILITYTSNDVDIDTQITTLKAKYDSRQNFEIGPQKLWKIPVCYDFSFGLDLEELSKAKKLSIPEIVRIHSEAIYKVYFIGFLPGFLYLGGLDKLLFTPRRASPRSQIEKGAIGIGGEQTGVYPNASPGGWNIIGNSPIAFFNPKLEQPCFAKAGDCIQFVPVDFKTHQEISSQVKNGTYKIESEVLDG
ncbi:5-oxoprolinase subunit PxpB [Gelidibacter maritimus]|uniref:5-oxoprolinase subunit PxpB n=1 Tax=Gelidibacter maritimus TaxID=2761487 RepID=A0A7W2R3Y4_9FLAO|nr:5-oxoprolinase subunit PxpB [Gelidibacter maritimus]MBA6152470.1 5-oxoprolinase subunit PxpB [Gelidibacter maritimus]